MTTRLLRRISGLFASAVVAAILVIPSVVAATPYGGGKYGDCKYNNGCPASSSSSSGGSGSTATTTTSEPAKPGETLLNDFTEYTQGDGKTLELSKDQKVVFDITKDGETTRYTAVVKEINEDSAVITIAGQEITLTIGQTQQIDVDGDGKADIEVTLEGITDGKANLKFRAVVLGAATTNTPSTATPTTTTEAKKSSWLLPVISALFILLGIIWFIVLAKRRKQNQAN